VVERFQDDDAGYRTWLYSNMGGYVVNAFAGYRHVVHVAPEPRSVARVGAHDLSGKLSCRSVAAP
jgi:hypothetical protein